MPETKSSGFSTSKADQCCDSFSIWILPTLWICTRSSNADDRHKKAVFLWSTRSATLGPRSCRRWMRLVQKRRMCGSGSAKTKHLLSQRRKTHNEWLAFEGTSIQVCLLGNQSQDAPKRSMLRLRDVRSFGGRCLAAHQMRQIYCRGFGRRQINFQLRWKTGRVHSMHSQCSLPCT